MLRTNADNAGLSSFFDALVRADTARVYSPDPRAYRLGVDLSGLPKSEILFAAFGGWMGRGWSEVVRISHCLGQPAQSADRTTRRHPGSDMSESRLTVHSRHDITPSSGRGASESIVMNSSRWPSGSWKKTEAAGIHAMTLGSSVRRPWKSRGSTPASRSMIGAARTSRRLTRNAVCNDTF